MANESKMHKIQVSKVKSVTHDLLCKLTLSVCERRRLHLRPHLGFAATESLIISLRHHFRLTLHYISNQPNFQVTIRAEINSSAKPKLLQLVFRPYNQPFPALEMACVRSPFLLPLSLSILSIIKPQYTAALLH